MHSGMSPFSATRCKYNFWCRVIFFVKIVLSLNLIEYDTIINNNNETKRKFLIPFLHNRGRHVQNQGQETVLWKSDLCSSTLCTPSPWSATAWSTIQSNMPINILSFTIRYINNTLACVHYYPLRRRVNTELVKSFCKMENHFIQTKAKVWDEFCKRAFPCICDCLKGVVQKMFRDLHPKHQNQPPSNWPPSYKPMFSCFHENFSQ